LELAVLIRTEGDASNALDVALSYGQAAGIAATGGQTQWAQQLWSLRRTAGGGSRRGLLQ